MEKSVPATSAIVSLIGGIGGLISHMYSEESVGYYLQQEGRVVLKSVNGGIYDEAWRDLEYAYGKKRKSGNLLSTYDTRSLDLDSLMPYDLDNACWSVLNRTFQGVNSFDYLFAKEWCSVKEKISEFLKEEYEKVKEDEWSKITLTYYHLPDKDAPFKAKKIYMLNSHTDVNSVKNTCKNRLNYFYVDGSYNYDLFKAICTSPHTVAQELSVERNPLDTDGSSSDSAWQHKLSGYKKKYPKQKPMIEMDFRVDDIYDKFDVTDIKYLCKRSLEKTILKGTELDLVSETGDWCTVAKTRAH